MTPEEVYSFLKANQAPERLIKHHQLVVEAAKEIIEGLKSSFPQFTCDYRLVLVGAAIHDAGKTIFFHEISSAGNRHELEGEEYLIGLGVPKNIARFSRTHAHWNISSITIEDLLVALADVLWKGCRNEQLERLAIEKIARAIKQDFWEIFIIADSLFEDVSSGGIDKLNRSL